MINFDNNIFKLGLNTVPYKWKNFIILCSSGVDSIAASHFFINKINTHNYKQNNVGLMHSVATLHFNHNLRPQNNVMAESYRDFCRSIRTYPIVDNLNCADSTENQSRKQKAFFPFPTGLMYPSSVLQQFRIFERWDSTDAGISPNADRPHHTLNLKYFFYCRRQKLVWMDHGLFF
jgi:hypothetical protein